MDISQHLEIDVTRDRAWRRKINFRHRGRDTRNTSTQFKPEKNFKHLSGRTTKIKRARQLGADYPQTSQHQQRLDAQHDFWNISD